MDDLHCLLVVAALALVALVKWIMTEPDWVSKEYDHSWDDK